MPFAPGTHLGPYEIVSPLGAGGMGEVYRARDTRLGRDVAVKVLPPSFAQDPDRLRRFEQEARSAGALNHPNILAIFDFGSVDGAPYVVSELLEGESLRQRLSEGPIPPRKAVEYAVQVAQGLAAAHEKGIVHRDLKPENLFLTKDGRVKILDFGLAKLTHQDAAAEGAGATVTVDVATQSGVVLGTVGYMSPEQVRGRAADHRADLFSLGAVLYEMLAGQRAFRGDSSVETMNAILKDDPPEISAADRKFPPALERLVRRGVEKSPEDRFQSARDLAFALDALSGYSTPSGETAAVRTAASQRPFRTAALLIAILGSAGTGLFVGMRTHDASQPVYRSLTHLRGYIHSARFTPDGQSVVYGAEWGGKPLELFMARLDGVESRPLGLSETDILSITSKAEMALLVGTKQLPGVVWFWKGTLARAPLAGGAPRQTLENVVSADLSADGTKLAVARYASGRMVLEFPEGTVRYETGGYVSDLRLSPDGRRLAFADHPLFNDDRGSVVLLEESGDVIRLTPEWETVQGISWSPAGDEIWFTANDYGGEERVLYAVRPSKKMRMVLRVPAEMRLQDISHDGTVLFAREDVRSELHYGSPGKSAHRDLSVFGNQGIGALSADGKLIAFTSFSSDTGSDYAAFVQSSDGSSVTRLGDGYVLDISADGKEVLTAPPTTPSRLKILPIAAGEARAIELGNVLADRPGRWSRDGKSVLITGHESGKGRRAYLVKLSDSSFRPLTPEGYVGRFLSTDDRFLIATNPAETPVIISLAGGAEQPVKGIAPGETPLAWREGTESIFVQSPGSPVTVNLVDVKTGKRQRWGEVSTTDPSGVIQTSMRITPDGRYYLVRYHRLLCDLYVVEGLH
jgi:eukaryotic-like serine/threonine-protein kinase